MELERKLKYLKLSFNFNLFGFDDWRHAILIRSIGISVLMFAKPLFVSFQKSVWELDEVSFHNYLK